MPIIEVVSHINPVCSTLSTKPSHIHAWRLGIVCILPVLQCRGNFVTGSLESGANYYLIKASKARSVANATFAVEDLIGCVPPHDARILYMARVDPHLVFAAEVVLDVDRSLLDEFAQIQQKYLRRMLGLSERSMIIPLFTKTGVWPIKYCCLMIAITYLQYLLALPASHYACAAFEESVAMDLRKVPCWLSDLRIVLMRLPTNPVMLPGDVSSMTVDDCQAIMGQIKDSCVAYCRAWVEESLRTLLLRERMVREENAVVISMRKYLVDVPVPKYRIAMARLMASEHPLAVERLRHNERYCPRVPRKWRLCRFCVRGNGVLGTEVEDELHALWTCTSNERLVSTREQFLHDAFTALPSLRNVYSSSDPLVWTRTMWEKVQMMTFFPKYVFDVFEIFRNEEIWTPAPYLYAPVM